MEVGVFARVLLVIGVVGTGRIGWLPAGVRFGQVRDQRAIVRCNIAIDGLKGRIIGHNPLSCMALHLHAHDLINLHRHRALGEVPVELANHSGAEPGFFEPIRTKGGAERNAPKGALSNLENFCPLRLQTLEVRIPIVDHAYVDRAQVQDLE